MKIEEELKQHKFQSIYLKASLNLMFTHNWLLSQSKKVFDEFDITHQQYNVLRILKGKHPILMSAHEIKSVMIDKSPDLTRLIDRLVNKRYVSREVCPDNRRKIEVGILEKGVRILEEVEPHLTKTMAPLKKLTELQAEQLSDLLDKIRD